MTTPGITFNHNATTSLIFNTPEREIQKLAQDHLVLRDTPSKKVPWRDKRVERALNSEKIFPSWKIAGQEAPEEIADLTATQVAALLPMILAMEKQERAAFLEQIPPERFELLTAEQLVPLVPQLKQKQIHALKSTLLLLSQDEIKMLWPEILGMTRHVRSTLIEILEPHQFALLKSEEVGPMLPWMTHKQVATLSPTFLNQVSSSDIFNFLVSRHWFVRGMPEPNSLLSSAQINAIWHKVVEMEPADRRACLSHLPFQSFAFLKSEDLGPVLAEFSQSIIRQLDASKIKELYPWILKMERMERILFLNNLENYQIYLLNEQERDLFKDDFTVEDLENIDLASLSRFELEKFSAKHIKQLFLKIIEHKEAGRLFRMIQPEQLFRISIEELLLLLASSFSFANMKRDHIQVLWPAIVGLGEIGCGIFIKRLNTDQLSLVHMRDIHIAAAGLTSVHIQGLWSRILMMDENMKSGLIAQLSGDQLERLSAAQIASVLHILTPEQIEELAPTVRDQLDLLLRIDQERAISQLSPDHIKTIWPVLLNMPRDLQHAFIQQLTPLQFMQLRPCDIIRALSMMTAKQIAALNWNIAVHIDAIKIRDLWPEFSVMDKQALRTLLQRLPVSHLSLLDAEALFPALGAMTQVQIQTLSAELVAELWPKVLLEMTAQNEGIINFVRQLLPHQLIFVKTTERPLVDDARTLGQLQRINPDELSEEQAYFLSADQVKSLWPNIINMDRAVAIRLIVNYLRPHQLLRLGEYELDLLSTSDLSNHLKPSHWQALWPEILRTRPQIQDVLINKISLYALKEDDIFLLLYLDCVIRKLNIERRVELIVQIINIEKASFIVKPQHIRELWIGIQWLNQESRVNLLRRLLPEQLSLLDASELSGVLGELTSKQIENLGKQKLTDLIPHIEKARPSDRIYFVNQLLPWQRRFLCNKGNVLDDQLTTADIKKINFSEIPQHQSILWRPELVKQLWPYLIKGEITERKTFLNQLLAHQLSLLDGEELLPVLEELTDLQIQSLSSRKMQQVWKNVLKMTPERRSAFLASIQPHQLSLLKGNELFEIFGELSAEQIQDLSVGVLQELIMGESKIMPLARIYLERCLGPEQKLRLSRVGIVIHGNLTPDEIEGIEPEKIPPHHLSLLWPDLAKHSKFISNEFIGKLSASQLYSLEEIDLASIIPKLTAFQVRIMLPELLRSGMREFFFSSLDGGHGDQLSLLGEEEIKFMLNELWFWKLNVNTRGRSDFIKMAPVLFLKWLPAENVGPVLSEMTKEQIKPLLDESLTRGRFDGLWPWILKMDPTKRNEIFKLFHSEIWLHFIIEFWSTISKMNGKEKSTLVGSILALLGSAELSAFRSWLVQLKPVEQEYLMSELKSSLRIASGRHIAQQHNFEQKNERPPVLLAC